MVKCVFEQAKHSNLVRNYQDILTSQSPDQWCDMKSYDYILCLDNFIGYGELFDGMPDPATVERSSYPPITFEAPRLCRIYTEKCEILKYSYDPKTHEHRIYVAYVVSTKSAASMPKYVPNENLEGVEQKYRAQAAAALSSVGRSKRNSSKNSSPVQNQYAAMCIAIRIPPSFIGETVMVYEAAGTLYKRWMEGGPTDECDHNPGLLTMKGGFVYKKDPSVQIDTSYDEVQRAAYNMLVFSKELDPADVDILAKFMSHYVLDNQHSLVGFYSELANFYLSLSMSIIGTHLLTKNTVDFTEKRSDSVLLIRISDKRLPPVVDALSSSCEYPEAAIRERLAAINAKSKSTEDETEPSDDEPRFM